MALKIFSAHFLFSSNLFIVTYSTWLLSLLQIVRTVSVQLCKSPGLKYSACVWICTGTKSPLLSLWVVWRTVNMLALPKLPLGRKAITVGFHVRHSPGLKKPCIRDTVTPPSIVAPSELFAISSWEEETADLGGKFNLTITGLNDNNSHTSAVLRDVSGGEGLQGFGYCILFIFYKGSQNPKRLSRKQWIC